MALDPAFLDELRNRTSLSSLIGRRNKLVRSGRNWKTCCPFHGEKSPSFHIYDDHFHCFGCGAHGDAISYVMQSEGRSFREAVEQLAAEAGLEMPRSDPRAEARAREETSLADVLALVQASYRRRLYEPEGRDGLAYLRQRGLSDATIERFGLGWSGNGRGLLEALRPHDVTAAMLVQAGMMRVDERGDPKGELFFNRVTFPIRDRRGRVISFGGRTLGDGKPKYLNGPETALFSKRRTLYNVDLAREAVHRGADLVVVEGYMDVIALDQAGFGGAVAPLGTALGEEQLGLLWRMSPTPILCLDGDAAGARAALRVCEVALPLLAPERSLRFCRLDPKDDPDSLIRSRGPQAMAAALGGASSLAHELFGLLVGGEDNPSPERRAALRERLVSLARLVPDKALSSEYRSTFLDMFFERFRRRGRNGGAASGPGGGAYRDDRSRRVALSDGRGVGELRHVHVGADQRPTVLTALLLQHPDILPQVEHAYSQIPLSGAPDALRSALLDWAAQGGEPSGAACRDWIEQHGLADAAEAVLAAARNHHSDVREVDDILKVEVVETWWHFYGLDHFATFEREVTRDIEDAIMRAYDPDVEPGAEGREAFPPALLARMRALDALRRGESPET